MIEIEVAGIDVFGRHGVNDDERERGQPFIVDVWLRVEEPREDVIDATTDYRHVRRIVHAVSDSRQFQLLEIFAAAIADRVVAELTVEHVRVRVRKPGVQWALHTAATVERP